MTNPTKPKYAVYWDNGNHACGTFPERYDTEEEAERAAENWVAEARIEWGVEEDDEDGPIAEAIEIIDPPAPDEESLLRKEGWER
jgi:hypothetical protein